MPDRRVLDGVPRVHFYEPETGECPEDITFPSCLRAWLQYMDDGYGCKLAPATASEWRPDCGYAYLVGLTGIGFWLGWDTAGDTGATGDPLHMAADTAEPFRRALEGLGYEHEILFKPDYLASVTGVRPACPDGCCTEADFRARIVKSIDAGRPAIGFAVVGPPEACLITGYDDDGDVLLGWSFLQKEPDAALSLEFEPSGYFRKRNWFADTQGLVVIGARKERSPAREVHRSALEWGLQVMRTSEAHGRASGSAAYRAWVELLKDDASFAGLEEEALVRRYRMHDFVVGLVAEARWYASLFLRQVASQSPEMANDLNAAADCFAAEHDLMWAVWEFAKHGEPEEHPRRFAQNWIRERIAPLVRLSWQQDEQAAQHMERALSR